MRNETIQGVKKLSTKLLYTTRSQLLEVTLLINLYFCRQRVVYLLYGMAM